MNIMILCLHNQCRYHLYFLYAPRHFWNNCNAKLSLVRLHCILSWCDGGFGCSKYLLASYKISVAFLWWVLAYCSLDLVQSCLGNWMWLKKNCFPMMNVEIMWQIFIVWSDWKWWTVQFLLLEKSCPTDICEEKSTFCSWRSNYLACFQILTIIFAFPTLTQICWAFVATLCTCPERSPQENICSWCCIKSTTCSTNRCFLSSCCFFTPSNQGKNVWFLNLLNCWYCFFNHFDDLF